jgi:tetratricopeptide (TPR) repeat protein
VHGDEHLAAALFERSLEAARRVDDPYVLGRTLLMAAWMPFWRNQMDESEAMFREALAAARSTERRDAPGEVRALVGIATVISVRADEQDALQLGLEALAIAEDAGAAFSEAIARQSIASSLRRMLRLEDALDHAEASIRTLRELGAKLELAGSLAERGEIHRAAGRLEDGEADLREALILCGELAERSLVLWITARLAETVALRGDVAGASAILADPRARLAEGEPGGATSIALAESVTALVGGDAESAGAKAVAAVEAAADPLLPNVYAAAVWFTGSVFSPDLVGGPEVVQGAREQLERNGWRQALREPEILAAHV